MPARPPGRLVPALRSLRRAVRLRRRLLAAGLAAGAVAMSLEVLAPPPPPTVPVVVARTDLAGGAALSPDDLSVRRLGAHNVPAGATSVPRPLVGRLLASPARAGEPLTDVRLVGPALLRGYPPGVVAAPVRIADAESVGLLRVGDRIDVLAPDPRGLAAPSVPVTDAPVVALPRPRPGIGAGSSGALVVLAVTPAEASLLARQAVLGPLVVTLRE